MVTIGKCLQGTDSDEENSSTVTKREFAEQKIVLLITQPRGAHANFIPSILVSDASVQLH